MLAGNWRVVIDPTAAAGASIGQPDRGAAKVTSALASPVNYVELPFVAARGTPYHLWIRGKAQNNSWANDSVFVQFSGSVTASGEPTYRIGTTAATTVNLEDGPDVGVSGWGWQDNGYGVGLLGTAIYFDGEFAEAANSDARGRLLNRSSSSCRRRPTSTSPLAH